MEATVTHLPGEPILIVTVAECDGGGASRLHGRIAEAMKQIDGPVYRIMDFSAADVTFNTMMAALREETRGRPGSASDPRIRDVFVGGSEILTLAARSLGHPQYLGREIPILPTLVDALNFVRSQMAGGRG